MAKVVGVRFKTSAKVYYFAPNGETFDKGDGVVVETARGVEFATCVFGESEVPDESVVQPLKPIIRKATQKDMERAAANAAKIPQAKKTAEERIAAHNLKMKLIDVEYTFDGAKIIFY
ncbi:MAG: stage 0 sporulation protein, partial [Clostridia bacterium]|nr:stage 0 sporulation protein [Clostridia bacterium]